MLNKVDYVANETIITAENLNQIQNAIISMSEYVDSAVLPIIGGQLKGPLDMTSQAISNLPSPVYDGDAVNKKYANGLRVRNLLDNGDFANPVNQRGQTSYSGERAYSIDRWIRDTDLTLSVSGSGIRLISAGNDWWASLIQRIEIKDNMRGKDFTFAAHGTFLNDMRMLAIDENGKELAVQYFPKENGEKTRILTFRVSTTGTFISLYISPDTALMGNEVIVQWADLYPGSYTLETLPPHVPKGYAAELAECQRYYFPIGAESWLTGFRIYGSGFIVPIPAAANMRVCPTVVPGSEPGIFTSLGWNNTTSIAARKNGNEVQIIIGYDSAINTNIEDGKAYLVKGIEALNAEI